jgi:methylisocitrate lyase
MVMGFSVGVAFGLLDNTGVSRQRQPGVHNPALLLKTNPTFTGFARQEFSAKYSPAAEPPTSPVPVLPTAQALAYEKMAGQNQLSPGKRLRQAWAAAPVAIPGAFNALTAKLVERLGFRAVYLSGGALSASSGVPDIGLLTLTEFADEARRLTAATSLPLLCDADTGFGEVLNVERTVLELESAGAAGIHLEDQQFPKKCGHLSGKSVVEPDAFAAKIRAAVAAKRDPDFVLIARTDARGVTGFDDAVRRAHLYLKAGADVIFPEALESAEEFERFAREVPAPLLANMTEFGKGPLLSVSELGAMGYKLVLYPLTAFRAAMKAAAETLAQLRNNGHQRDALPRMQTRAELYDLLGYSTYEERDRRYSGQ